MSNLRRLKNPELYFEKYINNGNMRILGNFDNTKFADVTEDDLAKMSPADRKAFDDEYQKFFANSRLHGLDGSIELAIGGSDQAIINGFGYKGNTPSSLYYAKTFGINKPISFSQQEIFDTGHRAEEYIANSFELATGLPVFHWPLQIVNEKYPHCIADIDGIVVENGKIGIYEGKCPQQFITQQPWMTIAKYGNTPETQDFVPIGYRLQVWYYLAVYELDFAYICGGGWGYSKKDIGYCRLSRLSQDEEAALMDNAESFITHNCLKKIRPSDIDVQNKESILAAYGDIYSSIYISDKPVKLNPSLKETFDTLISSKNEADKIKKEISSLKQQEKKLRDIQDACTASIAEACFGHKSGKLLVDNKEYRFYANYGTPRAPLDYDLLKKENPIIFRDLETPFKIDLNRLKRDYPALYDKYKVENTRTLKYKVDVL